ncbi:hypothetical protein GCM10029992_09680 [Glycomyces albus]
MSTDRSPKFGGYLPEPIYASWEDYLACTTERERLQWCRVKAKTTNRRRLTSDRRARAVTALDVWRVAEAAQGRCTYCAGRSRWKAARPAMVAGRRRGHRLVGASAHLSTGTNSKTADGTMRRTLPGRACGATPGSPDGDRERSTTARSLSGPLGDARPGSPGVIVTAPTN